MQNIILEFCSYQLQNKHIFPNSPKYFYDIILWHIFAPQLQKENKTITDLKDLDYVNQNKHIRIPPRGCRS